VRQAIAGHEFAFGFDQPLGVVSVSGGVAECPVDGADAATLVRAADEALYQAKRAGRNRVLAHRPTYLGGDEAQLPLPIDEAEDPRALAASPAPEEAPPPHGTSQLAADFTPAAGTLLALASITPAAGVARLTRQPTQEVLAAALAAHPPAGTAAPGGVVEVPPGTPAPPAPPPPEDGE
jgi:hypothetical protein